MLDQLLEFSTNHSLLVLSFFALSSVILFTEIRNISAKFASVGPSAAVSIINDESAVLLDVREPAEMQGGVLNDSIHIPLSSVNTRLQELDKHKQDAIVVYCRSGSRSRDVCRKLSSRGFEKVYNLAGGIMAWQDAHLPVSQPKKSKPKKKKK